MDYYCAEFERLGVTVQLNTRATADSVAAMGTTIFLATIIIGLNVLVDVAYTIVDPRIKLK